MVARCRGRAQVEMGAQKDMIVSETVDPGQAPVNQNSAIQDSPMCVTFWKKKKYVKTSVGKCHTGKLCLVPGTILILSELPCEALYIKC